MTLPATARLLRAATDLIAAAAGAIGQLPLLVVFSRLRRGFVHQRLQQMLSRLAARWRVVFTEEPVPASGPARTVRHTQGPNLEVWVPDAAPGQPRAVQAANEAALPSALPPVYAAPLAAAAGD